MTSYDHGDPDRSIAPSECSKYISISTSGKIDLGSNVAVVRPEAPVAGYKYPEIKNIALLKEGTTNGTLGYEIIDAGKVR